MPNIDFLKILKYIRDDLDIMILYVTTVLQLALNPILSLIAVFEINMPS